jgi:hypothetical protein
MATPNRRDIHHYDQRPDESYLRIIKALDECGEIHGCSNCRVASECAGLFDRVLPNDGYIHSENLAKWQVKFQDLTHVSA